MMHATSRKRQVHSTTFYWILVFGGGFLAGIVFCILVVNPTRCQFTHRAKGVLEHISNVPFRPTSHVDPKQESFIMKQQLIEPFEISNIAGLSVATLRPGRKIAEHEHESMLEAFYVLSGRGTISINQHESSIYAGHFVLVVPGERHSLWVDNEASQDMVFLVLGIAEGPRRR